MASSQSDSASNPRIHIPTCGNTSCEEIVENVVQVLEESHFSCMTEYKPGGLYKNRFEEAFTSTCCSIIHLCPEMVSQVITGELESVLDQDPAKVLFVRLEPQSSQEPIPDSLQKFNISDLRTPRKRTKFLDFIVSEYGKADTAAADGSTGDDQESDVSDNVSDQTLPGMEPVGFSSLPMVLRPQTNPDVGGFCQPAL
ncbi:uncharacterized protein LOC143294219 [Babylonia areolata]|uniref:uncharacterized protein LOC143294219 n=1 Tax=Babylonia areolata TaxID=304850 RepID=UPI003FD3824A